MSHGVIIKDAVKRYGDFTALKGVNLEIKQGEFFTLLGPSGCGKTTLLRMIAGFNSVDGGEICFDDKVINNLEAHKRDIGMVFQNYAIFPHLTVAENVAYGLKAKKYPKDQIPGKVEEALDLVQIKNLKDRKPNELSGGQQQRVALARAFVIEPGVLLMDEPLSNLDAKLRVDMRQAIREIQREVGITTVYVTHDQEEAMAISDSIAVMNQGRIQQVGRPKELYHRPKNEFVASFIGRTNIIQANLKHDGTTALLEFSTGYRMPLPILNNVADQPVHVSIRPEELIRTADGDIDAQITDSVYLGMDTEYFVDLPFAKKIHVSEESSLTEDLGEGDHIKLKINAQKINVFTADGSQNLLGVD